MTDDLVTINRAPVMTLWAALVAERLGYSWPEALSLGKAVAGLNAQSKGRSLGVYGPPKETERSGPPKKAGLGEEFWVSVCGRPVPAIRAAEGVRAVTGDKPVQAEAVQRYLETKFGADLPRVQAALATLAARLGGDDLQQLAYELYERFRPAIPPGKRGWGQAGILDLGLVRGMAEEIGAQDEG
jgi:hypothetical protein